ncbi:MAG: hypothetical protein EP297_07640 [Gammaproteobacteria bacterium]|nr:MAG: hypothetical protein EP297_07640 [Gammaproteobacteria bacterium]
MQPELHKAGVVVILLQRLENYCLPRALKIKEKVDLGGLLDEFDIDFMEEMFSEISESRSVIQRDQECERLAASMMQLYMQIADQAMLNEKQAALRRRH